MIKEIWSLGPNLTGYPGGYPNGFLRRVKKYWPGPRILHVCAGSVDDGIRLDIRVEALKFNGARAPSVRADGQKLPFKDGVFDLVLIDPPYSEEEAKKLYNTSYPGPWKLLAEAKRVVKPRGFVGILHRRIIEPGPYKPWSSPPKMKRDAIIGVTIVKSQSIIRAFQVWRKEECLDPYMGLRT